MREEKDRCLSSNRKKNKYALLCLFFLYSQLKILNDADIERRLLILLVQGLIFSMNLQILFYQLLVTLLKLPHKINSHRFYTQLTQTQWLKQKTQKFVFSQFCRPELQNQVTDMFTKPGGSRGEISNASSQFLFIVRNPWCFFTCKNITSTSPTWPHHFLLYIIMGYFLFLVRTLSLNLGVSSTCYNVILFFVLIICTNV